jgi:hypothetical protein
MDVERMRARLNTRPDPEPFPHIVVDDFLSPTDLAALRGTFPPLEAFEAKGKGLKRDMAIDDAAPTPWRALRDSLRASAPTLSAQFEPALHEKYEWLLGREIAAEVLNRGFTTTDGRLMGRGRGYRLDAHLDSAHYGITCLLYFANAETAADGALCLCAPERTPEVRHASTYYPANAEGIPVTVSRVVSIAENRFVAFLNGPRSLHSVRRPADAAEEWRFAYQCHIVPDGFDIRQVAGRLRPEHYARWADILSRRP